MTSSVRADHTPVTLHVPFAASSVRVARRKLKRWMSDQGSSRERIEDARVVVSELVANSVRHAQPLPDGNIQISWALERRGFELTVSDGGSPTRPCKLNTSASALAGRGMVIVDVLAISWWAEQTRSRATVHAVLAMI